MALKGEILVNNKTRQKRAQPKRNKESKSKNKEVLGGQRCGEISQLFWEVSTSGCLSEVLCHQQLQLPEPAGNV